MNCTKSIERGRFSGTIMFGSDYRQSLLEIFERFLYVEQIAVEKTKSDERSSFTTAKACGARYRQPLFYVLSSLRSLTLQIVMRADGHEGQRLTLLKTYRVKNIQGFLIVNQRLVRIAQNYENIRGAGQCSPFALGITGSVVEREHLLESVQRLLLFA